MSAPTAAETAAVLGVRICTPRGRVACRFGGRIAIGKVVIQNDGIVRAVPRHGLDEAAYTRLLATATRAAIVGRGLSRVWHYEPGVGWTAAVLTWERGTMTVESAHSGESFPGGGR